MLLHLCWLQGGCLRVFTPPYAEQLRPGRSAFFSPRRPAGRRAAACLTAHCACRCHRPWLLDVGGGEGLQEGREDPNGNQGWAERDRERK